MKACRYCKFHEGDGFPYGDVKCNFDNRYKYQYHDCDYPEKLKPVMILPDKECANCKHGTSEFMPFASEIFQYCGKGDVLVRVLNGDVCSLWQGKEGKL